MSSEFVAACSYLAPFRGSCEFAGDPVAIMRLAEQYPTIPFTAAEAVQVVVDADFFGCNDYYEELLRFLVDSLGANRNEPDYSSLVEMVLSKLSCDIQLRLAQLLHDLPMRRVLQDITVENCDTSSVACSRDGNIVLLGDYLIVGGVATRVPEVHLKHYEDHQTLDADSEVMRDYLTELRLRQLAEKVMEVPLAESILPCFAAQLTLRDGALSVTEVISYSPSGRYVLCQLTRGLTVVELATDRVVWISAAAQRYDPTRPEEVRIIDVEYVNEVTQVEWSPDETKVCLHFDTDGDYGEIVDLLSATTWPAAEPDGEHVEEFDESEMLLFETWMEDIQAPLTALGDCYFMSVQSGHDVTIRSLKANKSYARCWTTEGTIVHIAALPNNQFLVVYEETGISLSATLYQVGIDPDTPLSELLLDPLIS